MNHPKSGRFLRTTPNNQIPVLSVIVNKGTRLLGTDLKLEEGQQLLAIPASNQPGFTCLNMVFTYPKANDVPDGDCILTDTLPTSYTHDGGRFSDFDVKLDLKDRTTIIQAIKFDFPERSAASVYLEDVDLLVGYHASSDGSESGYDVYVFTESFVGDKLQPWQETMLNCAKYVSRLGTARPSSLKAVYACSFHGNALTDEEVDALAKRFAFNG